MAGQAVELTAETTDVVAGAPGGDDPPTGTPGTSEADAALAEALVQLDAATAAWRTAHNL